MLLPLAKIELGTATIGAIPSRPFLPMEVIPRGYRASNILTIAFHRPHVLPSACLPPLAQPQSLVIPIATSELIELGSNIIVFRVVFEGVALFLQLCLVALVAIFLGLLSGRLSSNTDTGVAVATLSIQFAQIVRASRQQQVYSLPIRLAGA
ncbi:MAG: hypothetical protein Q9190_001165 [Brigantiaea leucoxantha]